MSAADLFAARIRRESATGPLSAAFVSQVETFAAGLRVRGDMSAAEHGGLRALMRQRASAEGLDALGPVNGAEHEFALDNEDLNGESPRTG